MALHPTDMPKISVVVPTFNSERFVDECLQSLFTARGAAADLEVIVVDGGSTDRTLARVQAHGDKIAKVITEPDDGIYDAVNKGFAHSTGEVMTWISSNDVMHGAALAHVSDIFDRHRHVNFVTGLYSVIIDEQGLVLYVSKRSGISRSSFLDGCHTERLYPCSSGYIQQEGTFWRRSLWDAAGAHVSTAFGPAGDFELWTRFFEVSDIVCVRTAMASFRKHAKQTSVVQGDSYAEMARQALQAMQKKFSHTPRDPKGTEIVKYSQQIVTDLQIVNADYFNIGSQRDNGILKTIASGDHFT